MSDLHDFRVAVMAVVSDPYLTWTDARARLCEALNHSFVDPPGLERCPDCGNLAMNPLPSCSTCGAQGGGNGSADGGD